MIRCGYLLRACLRAGAFELAERTDVPVKVVINEYVELAHLFFDAGEPAFVNAVLDRLAPQLRPTAHRRMTLGEFELIDRLLKPLARGYPGALRLADDAALVDVPAGHAAGRRQGRDGGRRPFSGRRPARAGRRQAAAGQPLRPRRHGRRAAGLPDGARPLADHRRCLAAPVRGRPDGRPAALRLPPAGRRHGLDPRAADAVADHPRHRAQGPGAAAVRARAPATTSGSPARSATPRSACACCAGWRSPRTRPWPWSTATARRARAWRWARRCAGSPRAAIDVSDGLVADLGHMLQASGVGAVLDASLLPLSAVARGIPGAREAALTGGDDYELLFTAPADRRGAVEGLSRPARPWLEPHRRGSSRAGVRGPG